MENLQYYPFLLLIVFFALGFWSGRKNGIKKGQRQVMQVIKARLGNLQQYVYLLAKKDQAPVRVQGTMDIIPPEPWELKNGVAFGFKFTPDKTQWTLYPTILEINGEKIPQ